MRKVGVLLIAVMLLLSMSAISGEMSTRFHQIIADYFDVKLETVTNISSTGVADNDLAVLFFVAQETGETIQKLAKLRNNNVNWNKIIKSRTVNTGDFFVLIMSEVKSKTYEPIFKKFRDTKEEEWDKLVLNDTEIADLVNLKVISRHHDFSVYDVMNMRDVATGFARVNHDVTSLKTQLVSVDETNK